MIIFRTKILFRFSFGRFPFLQNQNFGENDICPFYPLEMNETWHIGNRKWWYDNVRCFKWWQWIQRYFSYLVLADLNPFIIEILAILWIAIIFTSWKLYKIAQLETGSGCSTFLSGQEYHDRSHNTIHTMFRSVRDHWSSDLW